MKKSWKFYVILLGCLVLMGPMLLFCIGGYLAYFDPNPGHYMVGKDTVVEFSCGSARYRILKSRNPDRLTLFGDSALGILDNVTDYKEWSGLVIVKSDFKIIVIDCQTGKMSIMER